jgi:hypothetical protein
MKRSSHTKDYNRLIQMASPTLAGTTVPKVAPEQGRECKHECTSGGLRLLSLFARATVMALALAVFLLFATAFALLLLVLILAARAFNHHHNTTTASRRSTLSLCSRLSAWGYCSPRSAASRASPSPPRVAAPATRPPPTPLSA